MGIARTGMGGVAIGLMIALAGCVPAGPARGARTVPAAKLDEETRLMTDRAFEMIAQRIAASAAERAVNAPTAPYALILGDDGGPVLVVAGDTPQVYTIDVEKRTLTPTTLPSAEDIRSATEGTRRLTEGP